MHTHKMTAIQIKINLMFDIFAAALNKCSEIVLHKSGFCCRSTTQQFIVHESTPTVTMELTCDRAKHVSHDPIPIFSSYSSPCRYLSGIVNF